MNNIIDFYSHAGTDNAGRTLKIMWGFTPYQLETVHDYIQWMFPTISPSEFNLNAPIIDEEIINAFNKSHELQSYLITSSYIFERFLDLNNPKAHWLTHKNHNFIRISRIIDSLCTLSCKDRALDFSAKVTKIYLNSKICPVSYWNNIILEKFNK